jgi:hypothetical protein
LKSLSETLPGPDVSLLVAVALFARTGPEIRRLTQGWCSAAGKVACKHGNLSAFISNDKKERAGSLST